MLEGNNQFVSRIQDVAASCGLPEVSVRFLPNQMYVVRFGEVSLWFCDSMSDAEMRDDFESCLSVSRTRRTNDGCC